MKTLCIIPARGGSKGIPRKNLRVIAGKPLIAWSIEVALAAESIDRVIVSTDDKEISEVARAYGAEVVDRPAELANDTASSESALLHVLDFLKQHEQYEADLIVFLQPTSPFRLATDIDGAVALLLEKEFTSVFSACAEHFTGRWSMDSGSGALPLNFDPANRPRRQERAVEYLENGSLYVFRPESLRSTGTRMGGSIGLYPMPPERSLQIDNLEDLEFFNHLLSDESLPIAHSRPSVHSTVEIRPPHHALDTKLDLSHIQLLALDFDGVLTDNLVWIDADGHETVRCSRSDSWGISKLKEIGVQVAVISTERNPVVDERCRKLDVPCVRNCKDKAAALAELAASMNMDRASVAFVGNDTNDCDALRWAGVAILVNDANPALMPLAACVLRHSGGHGAVREICDAIIHAKSDSSQ